MMKPARDTPDEVKQTEERIEIENERREQHVRD